MSELGIVRAESDASLVAEMRRIVGFLDRVPDACFALAVLGLSLALYGFLAGLERLRQAVATRIGGAMCYNMCPHG